MCCDLWKLRHEFMAIEYFSINHLTELGGFEFASLKFHLEFSI